MKTVNQIFVELIDSLTEDGFASENNNFQEMADSNKVLSQKTYDIIAELTMKFDDKEAIFPKCLFDYAPNSLRIMLLMGFCHLILSKVREHKLAEAIANSAFMGGNCNCEKCTQMRKEREAKQQEDQKRT